MDFFPSFLNFLIFFGFFLDFCDFWIFWDFWDKKLKIKFSKVTTEHQKLPKVSQKSLISFFFARKSLGQSSPQELEVSPRSGPYLLVLVNPI